MICIKSLLNDIMSLLEEHETRGYAVTDVRNMLHKKIQGIGNYTSVFPLCDNH